MGLLSKVKDFLWKVRGVLNTDVKDLFKKSPVVAIDKAPELPTSTLGKIARAARALSPLDIEGKPKAKVICEHVYAILKQVWIRVEAKKFELRNEMICTKCKEHKIVPIG
jgi:hypothetical protein